MTRIRNKICFVSLDSYSILSRKDLGFAGGAETHAVLLARELQKFNFDISFITYGDGGLNFELWDGIKIHRVYSKSEANKLSLLKKITLIYRAMSRADCDVYFHEFGAPGIIAIYCLFKQKKFNNTFQNKRIV